MAHLPIDRADPDFAACVMAAQCPRPAVREAVMAQLLRSVAAAERVAPDAWSVTLFRNGFRLNVGAVEALTLFNGEIGIFLFGPIPARVRRRRELCPCTLAQAPHPSMVLYCPAEALPGIAPAIAGAHEGYVRGSAVTRTGKPRRASYARYHSPGLYQYAREAAGRIDCA